MTKYAIQYKDGPELWWGSEDWEDVDGEFRVCEDWFLERYRWIFAEKEDAEQVIKTWKIEDAIIVEIQE